MKIISVFLNESSQIVLGKLVRAKTVFLFVCFYLYKQSARDLFNFNVVILGRGTKTGVTLPLLLPKFIFRILT